MSINKLLRNRLYNTRLGILQLPRREGRVLSSIYHYVYSSLQVVDCWVVTAAAVVDWLDFLDNTVVAEPPLRVRPLGEGEVVASLQCRAVVQDQPSQFVLAQGRKRVIQNSKIHSLNKRLTGPSLGGAGTQWVACLS